MQTRNIPSKVFLFHFNPFLVVLLSEADNLSRNAQAGLRRTMEKYSSNCRLILCCENSSRIIAPIRSRCLCLRVSAPTLSEVGSLFSLLIPARF